MFLCFYGSSLKEVKYPPPGTLPHALFFTSVALVLTSFGRSRAATTSSKHDCATGSMFAAILNSPVASCQCGRKQGIGANEQEMME